MKKAFMVTLASIAVAVLFLLVWQPAIPQAGAAGQSDFSSSVIDHGRVLAGLGNCAACHTVDAEKPFAGGVSFPTPFGIMYSTNITPDPDAGIGLWSLAAFTRAMREGVAKDGSHLYPAFPYTHYKNLSDEDIQALYAFVMTRDPIAERAPDNQLQFPFNLRFLQAGWKLLFFDKDKRWQADPDQSDSYNRGAYIALGLGHCSACHTPRNSFGAEIAEQNYDGALVDDWYAPALNAQQTVPIRWNETLLYSYLRTGQSDYGGVAIGSMDDVVHQGLAQASDSDIQALSVFINSLGGAANSTLNESDENAANAALAKRLISAANQHSVAGDDAHARGEQLYLAACAACHYNSADNPRALRAELSLNSTVTADDPTNLLRITLEGVAADKGTPGIVMPAFNKLSDGDLIALVQFLRVRANLPQWTNLQQRLEDMRSGENNL